MQQGTSGQRSNQVGISSQNNNATVQNTPIQTAYQEVNQTLALRQSQVQAGNVQDLTRGSKIEGSRAASRQVSKAAIDADKRDPSKRAVHAEQQEKTADVVGSQEDHKIPIEQLFNLLDTSAERGLTEQKATEKNLELGDNKLPEKKKTPGWLVFLKELFNWFSIMLWVGSILCVVAYVLEPSQGLGNVYLAIILILVIFLTGAITYMQTAKSDALMDSFKNMIPTACNVIRGGQSKPIDPVKLVPGDIIDVKSGDKIPADIRILQSTEMKVDNSALTGESDPLLRSEKCTHDNVLETANMAFFGTLCKEGQGKAVVVKIGGETVLGQIADLVESGGKAKTPLRIELDRFVLLITGIAIGLGFLFFFLARFLVGYSWIDSMVFGIGILVANVPEGLLGCITISLAITAEKLAKKQVLVKNLEGVETLGSTSCICSDKTGTLTQNKMTVEHVWYDLNSRRADNKQKMGEGFAYEYEVQDLTFRELHKCAITSSEAIFQVEKEDYAKTTWLEAPVKGDASETALVKFFQPIEDIEDTRKNTPVATNGKNPYKMPFNSTNKYALTITVQQTDSSNYCVYIKGAPEKIWANCEYILNDGQSENIDENVQKQFKEVNKQYGKDGERVLGFAKLHLDKEQFPIGFDFNVSNPTSFNFPMQGFSFIGLISLQDPPKDTVPFAVQKCRSAGIKVVMVTGDQPPTAGAIAKQVNIIPMEVKTNIDLEDEKEQEGITMDWRESIAQSDAIVIHGDKINLALNEMNPPGQDQGIEDLSIIEEWVKKPFCVFARTTPAHKLKIVKACQNVGYICGVTGDGVNDSPAIKQGDIGISMGITGSDVTKDAADMILLNDDFASIVDGVEEGRKIFDNLKKTVVYLLTSNVTEIFPFVGQVIFLLPLPLSNMLMLCICVGTDILPALSLAYEAAELDVMTRIPRRKDEHMVTLKLITHAYLQMGIIATAAGFFAYFSTMYYYGFTMSGLFGLQGNTATAVRNSYLKVATHQDEQKNPPAALANVDLHVEQISQIPFGSYIDFLSENFDNNNNLLNPAYYLGNPYLVYPLDPKGDNITPFNGDFPAYWQANGVNSIDCTQYLTDGGDHHQVAYYPKANDTITIDWIFENDKQFDLRQIIVQCEKSQWIPLKGTFRDCQHIKGSVNQGFNVLYDANSQVTKEQPHKSPETYDYFEEWNTEANANYNGENIFYKTKKHNCPVCYSTEALKYAQTAYFIAVVIVQWSNVLSVKAKKVSFIYTPWNSVMLYGVILETALCFILAYTPGIQQVFMSRPITFDSWCCGMFFSMTLLGWCEVRKFLLRRPSESGVNFFEKNVNW